jgi:hypothetical protein
MKYHRDLPEDIATKCNCVKCATCSCPCREPLAPVLVEKRRFAAAYSVNARQTIKIKSQCRNPNGVIPAN